MRSLAAWSGTTPCSVIWLVSNVTMSGNGVPSGNVSYGATGTVVVGATVVVVGATVVVVVGEVLVVGAAVDAATVAGATVDSSGSPPDRWSQ